VRLRHHVGASVSLTFDNLGEVSALERGQWPEDAPLGQHFSVTRALPRLLDLLAETGLRATFFVEGLNAELYPDTLRELDAAGHEVALHGWRHEPWADLDPARERELLERGVARFGELGLRPVGFRPPGGDLTPATIGLLRELGLKYCSPAGEGGVEEHDGIVVIPFRWELIDAWHYLPSFAGMRGAQEPLPPAALRAAVMRALDIADGHLTLLFHPFLTEPDERLEVLRDVLQRLRDVRCVPCRDVSRALRGSAPPASM
jgi:peptidoglycan/xylan/chitin deacetylase (PgdA/CDA1 family)